MVLHVKWGCTEEAGYAMLRRSYGHMNPYGSSVGQGYGDFPIHEKKAEFDLRPCERCVVDAIKDCNPYLVFEFGVTSDGKERVLVKVREKTKKEKMDLVEHELEIGSLPLEGFNGWRERVFAYKAKGSTVVTFYSLVGNDKLVPYDFFGEYDIKTEVYRYAHTGAKTWADYSVLDFIGDHFADGNWSGIKKEKYEGELKYGNRV
ncbi:MAG: hypothetical protein LUD47_07955 [Clostridia bacterium]|nr:hypothetical protein [Clostridia bacterium]